MMRLTKFIMLLLAGTGALSASAQSDYRLGYCDNSRTIGDRRIDLTGEQTSFEAAIYVPAEEMARVSDGDFTGVNVGINTTFNVESVKGWVRSEPDGENLAEAEITKNGTPAIKKGWNAIKFEEPLKITPGQGYYVGYTISHTRTTAASYVAVQSGVHIDGGCWLQTGNGSWSDNKELGILFLEALIKSESLPKLDLQLFSASFDRDVYPQGSQINLDYQLYNMGLSTVSSFDLVLSCQEAGIEIRRTVKAELPYNERADLTETYVLPDMEIDRSYEFTVTVDNLNGEADENPQNNTIILPALKAVQQMFDRTVVMEEFTTERCGNCPNAANNVRYMLNALTDEERERTALVCHHSGFYNDKFTQPCDDEYLMFYMGNTFAPAFMLDRAPTPESYSSPVFQLTNFQNLVDRVRTRQAEPSYYSIEATGKHDEITRTVKLRIAGKANLDKLETPRITVYLTEDDVPAIAQSHGGDNYKHQHVIRAYNATWGEDPVWADDMTYTYECELSYPESCDPSKMEIVALISNYQKGIATNMQIENAYKVALPDLHATVGIQSAEETGLRIYTVGNSIAVSGNCTSLEVYDLSGRRTATAGLPAGIYTVRATAGDMTETAKVIIR